MSNMAPSDIQLAKAYLASHAAEDVRDAVNVALDRNDLERVARLVFENALRACLQTEANPLLIAPLQGWWKIIAELSTATDKPGETEPATKIAIHP